MEDSDRITTEIERPPLARVYQSTTVPINKNNLTTDTSKTTKTKKQRRDKSDLGENFIAPDSGWAWLVCIAAGVSNLSIYPCLQQFGFLFRERLEALGMTSSEVTTIINTNSAISACTGLINGPMFRRYTFRQVAMAGSFIIFGGLMLTAFCETFIGYMIAYALLFGFGMGINVSASSLAINTYFKNKRRRAAGFSWTLTGLGPIFLPHVVTALVAFYGVQGTVLIFAAVSLHCVVCALIFQPVRYHVAKSDTNELNKPTEPPEYVCRYCEMQQKKETGIFSSQYLYQDDDEDMPGYEIIEPGTPMLSRANDGWFGSKLSLSSPRKRFRSISISKELDGRRKKSIVTEDREDDNDDFLKPNYFKREHDEHLKVSNSKASLCYQFDRAVDNRGSPIRCTCSEEGALLYRQHNDGIRSFPGNTFEEYECEADKSTSSISFLQKVVTFFDLDLLRDFTFVNLVVGLTIINFGELNFSILTPFILNDFGFDTSQTTTAMSVLAMVDITVRFFVPFVTEKISWDNRVFFLIGVVGIAIGRTVVACTRSFSVIMSCFVWIGMCKGVRTIFWPLVIPGYVPLNRLPAASGLQLLISGLFTLGAGPFVGLIRDGFNYSVCLHCLNIMSFAAATSWSLEALIRRYYRKRKNQTGVKS